jgi:hypothetical protein
VHSRNRPFATLHGSDTGTRRSTHASFAEWAYGTYTEHKMKVLNQRESRWAYSALRHGKAWTYSRLKVLAAARDVPIEVQKPLPWNKEFKNFFLEQYWQKRPLLVRSAFPADWRSPIGSNELAGLACEEGMDARVVLRVRPFVYFHPHS